MSKTVITVTFNRQIQPRQYETASAGITITREFDDTLDGEAIDVEAKALYIEAKNAVFTQLGIDSEAGEDGTIREIPKAPPAPAETASNGGGFSRTGRGSGAGVSRGGAAGRAKLSKEEAEQLWQDFMGRKANDFYDNLSDDEPSIKHKKSGQKLYLKYAPAWVKEELEEQPL